MYPHGHHEARQSWSINSINKEVNPRNPKTRQIGRFIVAMPHATIKDLYDSLRIPLSSKCIRLLNVHSPGPCTGAENTPIRCSLRVVDLDTSPSYAALSYVWNPEIDPSTSPRGDENVADLRFEAIYCNGIAVSVTPNCFSALEHLRQLHHSFTIWVDAICINQNDNKERAHQVRLMSDIYSGAHTTYVWLGSGTINSGKVIDYLLRAGPASFFFRDETRPETLRTAKPRFWGALLDYYKSRWDPQKRTIPTRTPIDQQIINLELCTWIDLLGVLDNEWASRIWTYQELILSRNPVVVYGLLKISWSRLALSIIFLACYFDDRQLQKWLDLVFARDLHQNGALNTPKHSSQLVDYWNFCSSLAGVHRKIDLYLTLSGFIIPLCTMLISIPSFKAPASLIYLASAIQLTNLVICIFPGPLIAFIYAPNPRVQFKAGRHRKSREYQISVNDMNERILGALSTRNATDPLDMVFGLHPVLRHFTATSMVLPAVNYSLSKSQVYWQLSKYMLFNGRLSGLLELAVQGQCDGAPSWVPDFSWNLYTSAKMLFPFHQDLDFSATGDSLLYHRLSSDDERILVVKGFVLGEIQKIQVAQPYYSIEFIIQGTDGQSFRGASNIYVDRSRIQLGDKVILVSGFGFPIIARDVGGSLRIITTTYLLPSGFPGNFLSIDTLWFIRGLHMLSIPMSDGIYWKAYEKKKRMQWLKASGKRPGLHTAPHPDPEEYLDDLYIS